MPVGHHPHHPYGSMASQIAIPFIKEVNENDVLCGRGGATNSHAGNRSYREIVKSYKDKYLKAKKKQKPNVAAEVVAKIRSLDPPGRFLKKDKETGWYLDIGDARAKEKTSQALREGAPLIRKQMSEGKRGNEMGEDEAGSDDGGSATGSGSGKSSPDKSFDAKPKSSGTSIKREEDEIDLKPAGEEGGEEAASAFSPLQPGVGKRDAELKAKETVTDSAAAEVRPDNSEEAATEKNDGESKSGTVTDTDAKDKSGEASKKRPSSSSPEEAMDSGESPMKRQMTGEGPVKGQDPFRDVFEPPRGASTSTKQKEGDKSDEEKQKDKEDSDSTTKDKSEQKEEDLSQFKDSKEDEEEAETEEENPKVDDEKNITIGV